MARVAVIPEPNGIVVTRVYYDLVDNTFKIWLDFKDSDDNASVLLKMETLDRLRDVLDDARTKVRRFQEDRLGRTPD